MPYRLIHADRYAGMEHIHPWPTMISLISWRALLRFQRFLVPNSRILTWMLNVTVSRRIRCYLPTSHSLAHILHSSFLQNLRTATSPSPQSSFINSIPIPFITHHSSIPQPPSIRDTEIHHFRQPHNNPNALLRIPCAWQRRGSKTVPRNSPHVTRLHRIRINRA